MTDPLAHLYAETGLGPDTDEDLGLERETSLEELTAETGEHVEEFSDGDVVELVVLLKARIEDGLGADDVFAFELGLGDLVDGDLVLNPLGRAVMERLLDERFPGVRRPT